MKENGQQILLLAAGGRVPEAGQQTKASQLSVGGGRAFLLNFGCYFLVIFALF